MLVLPTPIGFLGAPELIFPVAAIFLIIYNNVRLSAPSVLYLCFIMVLITANIINAPFRSLNAEIFLILRLVPSFFPFMLFDQIVSCTENQITRFWKYYIVSLGFSVVMGIGLFAMGIELRDGQQRLWFEGGSIARAGGLTANSAGFGFLCAIFVSSLWIHRSFYKSSRVNLLLIIIGLTGVLLASSRAAFLFLITMFLTSLALGLFERKKRLRLTEMFSIILLGLIVAAIIFLILRTNGDSAYYIIRSLVRLDILNLGGADAFFHSVRFDSWRIVLQSIQDNLIFGMGYKQFSGVAGLYSDNSFLGVTLDGGIFSFLAYLMFWSYCVLYAIAKYLSGRRKYKYLISFLLGVLAFATTVDLYSMWYPMALFFLSFAMLRLTLINHYRASKV